MKNSYYTILWLLPLLAGCVRELPGDTSPAPAADGIEAILTLRLPVPDTRALTVADESAIRTIDVLVFRDADGSKKFSYRATTTLVEGTAPAKNFRVSVKKDEKPQQLVILANAREVIDGLVLDNLTRDDALALVEMSISTAWNSTAGTFDPLPMWGETTFRVISDATTAAATIDLARAVARVDIDATAATGFTLEKAWLYNASKTGRLAPLDANWNALNKRVTTPSEPAGGWASNTTPLEYTAAAGKLERVIYAFEAPAAASNTSTTATCLLVKGSWNGESSSFYRVDFYNSSGTLLPLLRDHHYTVNITSVSGNGYPTAAEALVAGFSGLTAKTHVWANGGTGTIVWDERHLLAVSNDAFDLDPVAQILTINIATDYPEGWSATLSPDCSGWLTIDGSNTGIGNASLQPLKLNITENTLANRTGTITVTAGRLELVITVTQRLAPQLSLDVSDVEITFPGNPAAPRLLRVEWEPAATPCTVALAAVSGGGVTFAPALSGQLPDADAISGNGGLATLSLQPINRDPMNPFSERRSTLTITASNGTSTISKVVILRQFNHLISVLAAGKQDTYQPGTTYTLNVQSNVRWKVSVTGPAIASHTGNNVTGDPVTTTTGEAFTFTTSGTPGTTGTITIESEDPTLGVTPETVPVTVEQDLPNCYIVTPGTTITIPLLKAYKVWASDVDLKDINNPFTGTPGAELLWQDVSGLVTGVTLNGTGENANITVTTASSQWGGNAVVAFTIDGITRWSWHLWITNYNPNDPAGQKHQSYHNLTLMDRHLGATDNQPPSDDLTDVKSFGLYYQWGRKDPFRGREKRNDTAGRVKIYNISGTELQVQFEDTEVPKNLVNAIENPLVFYKGQATSGVQIWERDWYTNDQSPSVTPHRTDFWPNSSTKGAFDPCPAGWRVPRYYITEQVVYIPGAWVNYKGITLGELGFIPSAGRMDDEAFTINSSYIHVAQTSNNSSYGGSCYMTSTSITLSSTYRAVAQSVRCVKVQ